MQYRGGKLYGIAENQNSSTQEAKTIQAFLISSAFGNFKSVVSLTPVKNLVGEELYELTQKNIALVMSCGLKIISIISDNNRINRNMFQKFSANGNISFNLEGVPVHVFYDTVHIFKNIRNNWINLKDSEKTFIYPSFENDSVYRAKFSVIRNLYKKEVNLVVKKAPNLNYKTCYPTHFERQNVKLVANVFNEKTIAALSSDDIETADFIKIILKWWTIVNIKNKLISTIKLNNDAKPFNNVGDERFEFLEKFLKWLEQWKQISYGQGFLTLDTYHALSHTTRSLISLIKFSLLSLNVNYVLTGKFQTDNLERTFGKYRNLSGSNYNVSVQQVMEAEHKIRLNKLLGIQSARYGLIKFSFDKLPVLDSSDYSTDVFMLNKYLKILNDIEIYNRYIDESAIIYISGYATFKICRKISCSTCASYLSGADINDDYFIQINRGGLTVASDLILELAKLTLSIMNGLTSEKYEENFLRDKSHKLILSKLILESVTRNQVLNSFFNACCPTCSNYNSNILEKYISIFSNICLNNYIKLRTDALHRNKVEMK
jgi:hypothetical protein